MSNKPVNFLPTARSPQSRNAASRSACRFCGQPAQEQYRFWVGTLVSQTRSPVWMSNKVIVESQFHDLHAHDVGVCRLCEAGIWKTERRKEIVTALVVFVLYAVVAAVLMFLPQLNLTWALSEIEAGYLRPFLLGGGGLLGVWVLFTVLCTKKSYHKVESAVMEKLQPEYKHEGDTFFTHTEYRVTFLKEPPP
jgi:hypothetical protein